MFTESQSLAITKVSYLHGYELELIFNNQEIVRVDLESELYGEIFEPLKSVSVFQQVAIDPETHTIAWPNGADFAPEFLYQIGQKNKRNTTNPHQQLSRRLPRQSLSNLSSFRRWHGQPSDRYHGGDSTQGQ